jgi:hypothetical protein
MAFCINNVLGHQVVFSILTELEVALCDLEQPCPSVFPNLHGLSSI